MGYPCEVSYESFHLPVKITGVAATDGNFKPGIDPSRRHEMQVLRDIFKERCRQTEKWGDQSVKMDFEWSTVLAEEFGEVAKALLQSPRGLGWASHATYEELSQVAAVCVAWMEALRYRKVVS